MIEETGSRQLAHSAQVASFEANENYDAMLVGNLYVSFVTQAVAGVKDVHRDWVDSWVYEMARDIQERDESLPYHRCINAARYAIDKQRYTNGQA